MIDIDTGYQVYRHSSIDVLVQYDITDFRTMLLSYTSGNYCCRTAFVLCFFGSVVSVSSRVVCMINATGRCE